MLPPSFPYEEPDEDDALYPITRIRLAFLTRRVLADLSPSMATDWDAITELWDRRAELAARIGEQLDAYSREYDRVRQARNAAEIADVAVGALGFASFWLLAAALWETLQRLFGHGHSSLPSAIAATWPAWLVFAAVFVASRAVRGVSVYRAARAMSSYEESYAGFVHDDLTPAIAAMADEIVHRQDELSSGALLPRMPVPSLVEFGSATVVRSQIFADVLALVDAHVTSAVGVAGTRGAGKSTLLRLLCGPDRAASKAQARIGVYLAAPASSAMGDFVKVIYGTTVRTVIGTRSVSAGGHRGWRRLLRVRPDDEVVLAHQANDRITGSTSRSRQSGLGLSRSGMSLSAGRQRTWTERELSHADWVADFRDYLERHHLLGGDPILIAIDELDKIPDAGQAVEVINGLKDLFHIQGAHFIVSVSDDALRSFATRGVPVRDAFDSSFDTVVEIPHLTARESCELLQARVRFFPDAAALFCHAWSAGVPRDLIRAARSCAAIPHKLNDSVPITAVAKQIIRRDVVEFIDAVIGGKQDESDKNVEHLLELRRLVSDETVPLHEQLADPSGWHLDCGDDMVLRSLEQFLRIAATASDYFSVPRSSQQWADGVKSGRLHRDADLLAQAKAALTIHPSEAAWRLNDARGALGLTPHAVDQAVPDYVPGSFAGLDLPMAEDLASSGRCGNGIRSCPLLGLVMPTWRLVPSRPCPRPASANGRPSLLRHTHPARPL